MTNLTSFYLLFLLLFVCFPGINELKAQINFSFQEQFSYLKGSQASSLENDWQAASFDVSAWPKGNAPFRYDDGSGGTVLNDMRGSYSTLYLRSKFTATNTDHLGDVTFLIDYDDGFALWINGEEVLSKNAPLNKTNNSFATTDHESGRAEKFLAWINDIPLREGENTLAVQVFNVNLQSSDLYFDMSMAAALELPELEEPGELTFSHQAGFYSDPFDLTITASMPETVVLYTLDGSDPRTSTTAIVSSSQATIKIDPDLPAGRPTTPAFLVRASVQKEGYKPTMAQTRSFVFIEKVKTQTHPGGQWPLSNINNQRMDFDVDPRIINDPRYKDQINEALLDIPSLSVVTDMENLFDPGSGIYVNTYGRGKEWERSSSVELLMPDGSDGFQVNAGLRIRGGHSRRPDVGKHSFRLLFRKEYGNGKLHYPWFGDEGVAEFDRMDLRTAQNLSWHDGSHQHTFLREVFSRDTQKDMGNLYTRSRFYHLYLNGMYWGIYQTQERAEAFFAESYLGDKKEDYDVIKVTSENGYVVEATDGTLDVWNQIFELTKKGFASNADYFHLEGKDAEGKPAKNKEVLVDIDNLIDYMLIIFYSGNLDAPSSHFLQNKKANNFYAIFNKTDKDKGFKFLSHDAEWSLLDINENRVNIGNRNDTHKMVVNDLYAFHPQWLHFKLSDNKEYRMRFADRAYKHLKDGGALTPEKARERINKRMMEVETAIIAESARWGDTKTAFSLNKTDHWIPEVNYLRNQYIPQRTNVVINQLKAASLYSALDPPQVKINEKVKEDEKIEFSSSVKLSIIKQSANGDIYYTFTNEDPRDLNGAISDAAIKLSPANNIFDITASTILKARVYQNGEWSALKQLNLFSEVEDYSGLKLTELNYHPEDIIAGTDTLLGKDYEFIEFKNTGEHAINLSGLTLSEGVNYEFPDKYLLAAGEFFVITSKPSKFYAFYGMSASGNFKGNLSNSGETILLKDGAGNLLMDITYSDKSPWPKAADGDGYSLVPTAVNPKGDPSHPSYWTISANKGGSPFTDDGNDDDILGIDEIKGKQSFVKVFPNPTSGLINIEMTRIDMSGGKTSVALYTTGGKLVFKTATSGKVELKDLDIGAGLYIIKINSGKSVKTAKLIYMP